MGSGPKRRVSTVACCGRILAAMALASCLGGDLAAQSDAPSSDGVIVVGSKANTENRLLGEMMAQLIEAHTDIPVERRLNLGGTAIVFRALESGEIDVYPEYTGTGWSVLLGISEPVSDPLQAYLEVASEFQRRHQLSWLPPFGFENSYELAMHERVADALGIRTISDLLSHEDELRAGVSHEFLNRDDGYPGLAQAYGLDIRDLNGMEHGLAYEAILSNRVDLIDTWTTDGKLLVYDIRILEDDRNFFPPYDCAPVVRTETLLRYPEVAEVLGMLAYRIDDEQMQALNYQVEDAGGSYEAVAAEFLASEGLLDQTSGPQVSSANPDGGFIGFLWSRRAETGLFVLQHLWLTAIAVVLAVFIGIPLGVLLTRGEVWAAPVLGTVGVIQTIPSLALLAFMIPLPFLGLGARSAIAALFLYALLPIVRNTYTGVKEVDADLIEAGTGMGLSGAQLLSKVELPLATRTIMAGIRTATVISVGVATLAAFIGAGGLGDPIVTGLQLNDTYLILSGAVPAALLALLVDFVLGFVERRLVPRGLA
jgi:osmoprotectant transport system permease protein